MSQPKGEKKTDAERRAQNKYQAKTYKVVGCKLTKDVAERFIEKAKANGTNANAVLASFVAQYLENSIGG